MGESNWFGLIELFVVFGAVMGFGILELVCLRLDRKRRQDSVRAAPEPKG